MTKDYVLVKQTHGPCSDGDWHCTCFYRTGYHELGCCTCGAINPYPCSHMYGPRRCYVCNPELELMDHLQTDERQMALAGGYV